MRSPRRPAPFRVRLFWLAVFAAAFGVVEGAVGVYFRRLIDPSGFAFPLELPGERLVAIEIVREAATMVLLWAGAALAAAGWARFGAFCLVFGVWDLAYYAAHLAFLGWPPSLMTWDLLFLLPVPWTGPVLSALLVAVSLIVAGTWILVRERRGVHPRASAWVWATAGVSFALLVGAFCANGGPVSAGRAPGAFPWAAYALGFVLGWAAFGLSFHGGGGGRAVHGREAPDDTLF